jgi:glycosyltransferase involved in cell wall biosynthesis
MKSRRIAMLAPFGIRPKGTLIARMLPLAVALEQHGHHVWIVAPPIHNPQDAGRHDVYQGVSVLHTPRPTSPGAVGGLQHVGNLWRLAMTGKPDILHLFKPKGYSGLAALLARMTNPVLPLVVDTDDWEGWGGWNDLLPYPSAAKVLFAWQERDLPRRAQAVTVASHTLQTQVWGNGVLPERVFYLPNGISPIAQEVRTIRERQQRHTRQAPQQATILLYTRFWELDLAEVVATLVAIVQQRPDVTLLVIGQGEQNEEQELLRLACRAGVAHVIDYRGWVEPDMLPSLLAQADIAIAPMNDTLINRARCSAKLLELVAAGVPVAAAHVGEAAAYIRDGHSGLLVPPGNPAALAQAALALLADDRLRQRLGAEAIRASSAFAWDKLALTAEQAYECAMHY